MEAFPASPNRNHLFAELEKLIAFLQSSGLPCRIWVNGSFLTEKIEPGDIDVVIEFWVGDAEKLDPIVFDDIWLKLNGGKRFSPVLDTYLCVRYLREDSRRGADTEDYWGKKWGKGWDDWLKGYIVIAVGETDVQSRIAP